MKNVLVVLFAVGLLFGSSCNEDAGPKNTESASAQSDTVQHIDLHANENHDAAYYGIDSEDDTVVYEKDGVILNAGEVSGTFHHMERGDFMHIVIADSNGLLHSFFMNTTDQRQMDKYFEGYEPARGHPISVKWERGPLAISEDGSMVTVYQAKEITE